MEMQEKKHGSARPSCTPDVIGALSVLLGAAALAFTLVALVTALVKLVGEQRITSLTEGHLYVAQSVCEPLDAAGRAELRKWANTARDSDLSATDKELIRGLYVSCGDH